MHMNYKIIVTAIALIAIFPYISASSQEKNANNVEIITWNSSKSIEKLANSKHKVDFFPLSNNFVSQDNKIICGLASASIVLNALRLRKSNISDVAEDEISIQKSERRFLPEKLNPFFQKYTQNNIIKDQVKSKIEILGKPVLIRDKEQSDYGFQLRQLAALLTSHNTKTIIRVVGEDTKDEEVKSELIENLSTPNDYVIVNYSRKKLGQKGGGHISPLAAYDKESDSFLIMDVNTNKAPWIWVKSLDLINAMRTFDTIENRGYLLISD